MQHQYLTADGIHTLIVPWARLLLIDEDMEKLLYYTDILQDLGCDVTPCPSYWEAAGWFREEHFDLIIIGASNCTSRDRFALMHTLARIRTVSVVVLTGAAEGEAGLEDILSDRVEKVLAPSQVAELVAEHFAPKLLNAA